MHLKDAAISTSGDARAIRRDRRRALLAYRRPANRHRLDRPAKRKVIARRGITSDSMTKVASILPRRESRSNCSTKWKASRH